MRGWIRGELRGYVSDDEVFEFIKERFDKDVYNEMKTHNRMYVNKNGVRWLEPTTEGNIIFHVRGAKDTEFCVLFYSFSVTGDDEWKEHCDMMGWDDMAMTNNTTLILVYRDNSVDIMNTIVSHFGGWVDDTNSKDEVYRSVPKVESSKKRR